MSTAKTSEKMKEEEQTTTRMKKNTEKQQFRPPLKISTNNVSFASRTSGSTRGSQIWRKGLETPPVLSRAMKEAPREDHDPNNDPTINIRQALSRPANKQEERTSKENESNGIFSWSDEQLAERYNFIKEVGFGNWGSCWRVTAKQDANNLIKDKEYAIKLVHRHGTPPSNARVKALWNEYKVLRSCGKPGHPNLVHFKEFIITPSYALVAMDYYRQAMNVALPVSLYAGSNGYFKQLLSSINWLHERRVTHCDIKVANLLVDLSEDKVRGRPILVDFGFATLHDAKTNFHSSQTWGTPEYLSPERSRGEKHDERLSDVWALGVTFFEIATGRTPFEQDDEQFLTKEQLDEYYRRTMKPEWVGTWSIPKSLEKLCKRMLSPDPSKRCFTQEALQHCFFREDCSNDLGDIDASLREELSKEGREVSLADSLVYDPDEDGQQFAVNAAAAAAAPNIDHPKEEGHSRPAQSSVPTNFGASPSQAAAAHSPGRGQSSSVANATPDVSFSSFQLQQQHQQCTPPCVPKKNDRREQVKIVVDESDSEDIRNNSFAKNSSSASEGQEEDNYSEDVRDANTLLEQQQQGTPSTGSMFKELILTTPSKAGVRTRSASDGNKATPSKQFISPPHNRSPYPPSASRKVAVTKGTSSSERRHSQQDSPNEDSSIMVNGTSFELTTNSATTKLVTTKQDSMQNNRKLKDSELQSSISHTAAGTSINGEHSTHSPIGHYENHQAIGSIQTSLHTRVSDLSRMEQQVQEARRNSFLQFENGNGSSNMRELNTEHIFRRLEEMDELANTLASMVRDTRSVLQHYCGVGNGGVGGQEVRSPSSNGHHLPSQFVQQQMLQQQASQMQQPPPPKSNFEFALPKKHKRQMSISKLNVFSSRRKQSVASSTNAAMQMSSSKNAIATPNLNKTLPNPMFNNNTPMNGHQLTPQQHIWATAESQSPFTIPCNMSQEGTEILMRDMKDSMNHNNDNDYMNEQNPNQSNWWQHPSSQISDLILPSPHQPMMKRMEDGGKFGGKFVHPSMIQQQPSSTKKKVGNSRPNTASGVSQPFCQAQDGKRRPSEPEITTAGALYGHVQGYQQQQQPQEAIAKQKVSKVKVFNLNRTNSVNSTPSANNRNSVLLSPKGLAKLDCLSNGGQNIIQQQEQRINHHDCSSPITAEKHSPTVSLASISQVVAEGVSSPPPPSSSSARETNNHSNSAANVHSPTHSGGVLWRLLTNRGGNSNRNVA